jgi:uncharacterized membrane protein
MANLHVIAGAGTVPAYPRVRRIGLADLEDALRRGFADFWAMPTHVVFIGLIYPIIGVALGRLTLGYDVLSLLFPLAAGFALVGPFAAIGLYELSRRREQELPTTWKNAFDVLHSPSLGAILVLGVLLMIIFAIWLAVAQAIYVASFGDTPAASIPHFIEDVLTTPAGWTLIVVGNGVGFVFALAVLTISVVSFPLLLDRDVGAAVAVLTSVRAVAANPLAMAAWGLIVAALLLVGSLPFFIGLAIVVPVLGHATWHLYRKVVEP